MRVGLVCPYSLTVPGGVQGQVLGLARALRTLGHDVRVLAPSDGPPPDAGVTPLGKSIPMSSNGSLRDDVQRITQLLAIELEALIRAAPEQWHLFQPNWPSDPGYGE